MLLWERYIWAEMLKTFFGVLLGFYALYAVIDYANQLGSFREHEIHLGFGHWIVYYVFEFLHKADILIPFAALMTSIRVLLSMNSQNQLVALLCGGISIFKVVRPFVLFGLLLTVLLYVNQELLIPRSISRVKTAYSKRHHKKGAEQSGISIQEIPLDNGSTLIYQSYDPELKRLYDVYWIASFDDLYKMKHLMIHEKPPIGLFVEHLIRDENHELALVESFEEKTLDKLVIPSKKIENAVFIPEIEPISALWKQLPPFGTPLSPREAYLSTAFYTKAALPWLVIIAMLAPIPLCVGFARNKPQFFIYAMFIFLLVAFYFFMDSLKVLAKRQVSDPAYLLVVPIGLMMALVVVRLRKLA